MTQPPNRDDLPVIADPATDQAIQPAAPAAETAPPPNVSHRSPPQARSHGPSVPAAHLAPARLSTTEPAWCPSPANSNGRSPMITLDAEQLQELANMVADRLADRLAHRSACRFLTRREYAQAHRLGIRTVDRAIAENRLDTQRQGRRVLIPADAQIRK